MPAPLKVSYVTTDPLFFTVTHLIPIYFVDFSLFVDPKTLLPPKGIPRHFSSHSESLHPLKTPEFVARFYY